MVTIQYNAAIAIKGATRGTSREKLYQKLGLKKLWYLFKTFKSQSREYLLRTLPSASKSYNTINNNNIPHFNSKHNFFNKFFFSMTVIDWKNLDLKERNSDILFAFKKSILKL